MNPDRLAEDTIPVALRLVGAVRETPYAGVDDTSRILAKYDVAPGTPLAALLVVLAAMVDDEKTPAELLSWTGFPTPAPAIRRARRHRPFDPAVTEEIAKAIVDTGWTVETIRDAHADHQAGDRTAAVVEGHRIYDRARHAVRRARERRLAEQVAS